MPKNDYVDIKIPDNYTNDDIVTSLDAKTEKRLREIEKKLKLQTTTEEPSKPKKINIFKTMDDTLNNAIDKPMSILDKRKFTLGEIMYAVMFIVGFIIGKVM